MPIRVCIVEDDRQIRQLAQAIVEHFDDFECTGAFDSAEKFEASLASRQPDVVLMDISLPGKTGIESVRTSIAENPNIAFVMFTSNENPSVVFEALAAGALGYVLKGGTPNQIATAIREVQAGGSPMSRQISRLVAQSFVKTEKAYPELETLTEQEREVLEYLDQGLAYKEIAAQRFVTVHTVRTQVQSIYRKLHVHSRTEALNKLHGR